VRTRLRAVLLILTLVVAALGIAAAAGGAHPSLRSDRKAGEGGGGDGGHGGHRGIAHVLLISVDGLHQSDLSWYVANHPDSALAQLAHGGVDYAQAMTPIPSDSFPGMVAQVTGGNPGTTGVYYDAEYNHNLLPAGTTSCTGKALGAEVNYFEVMAKNPLAIDSGQGLPGLPDNVLQMTGTPSPSLINPKALPVDPATCQPVYPHQYIKVNTIFEVARQHGLRTAWSDKHVAYEILNGPSGTGIQDLFAPEINSNAQQAGTSGAPAPGGGDYTAVNSRTIQYDNYKVQAILNEIDGYDHTRSQQVGTPAIFGMNFQTVSTAQKLPVSDGLNGGYLPGTTTPGPLLSHALDYISSSLGAMVNELRAQGLSKSTAIIISAKHGQSPMDPNALTRIADGPIVAAINQAWSNAHPGAGNLVAADPGNTAAGSRDDAFPLWLNDRSPAAAAFVRDFLWSHTATGTTYNAQNPATAGPSRTLPHSGLKAIYAGDAAASYFGVSPSDPRHPDLWGVVSHGVVYTGGVAKIAEHGGADSEDRNVPILVYAPKITQGDTSNRPVETTQIAPTILRLLHLDPNALQAVQIEGTQVLPGLKP
jgi:Type I phosphodiesterase / nucleotide pyrophosphatase